MGAFASGGGASASLFMKGVIMRKYLIWPVLLICVCAVASQEWGDFSFMKSQKGQLFGWDYQGDYKHWLGVRGYGFGMELGYIGVVGGAKRTVSLSLPGWLVEDETSRDREIDLFFDGFTYVNLGNLALFPEKMRGWLFWELSFWFGVR